MKEIILLSSINRSDQPMKNFISKVEFNDLVHNPGTNISRTALAAVGFVGRVMDNRR